MIYLFKRFTFILYVIIYTFLKFKHFDQQFKIKLKLNKPIFFVVFCKAKYKLLYVYRLFIFATVIILPIKYNKNYKIFQK